MRNWHALFAVFKSGARLTPTLLAPTLLSALLIMALLPTLALAQGTAPESQRPASVPAHITRDIADARPAGQGKLTWFGLHVYDARLFVPARGIDLNDLGSQRFALDLTYARRLRGNAIAERSLEEIEKLGFGTAEQRASWLREMLRIFPDVSAGQTLTGLHLANGGTRFYLDGRGIGAIEDTSFGRAFFAIWLDPRTSAAKLRADLLHRATP